MENRTLTKALVVMTFISFVCFFGLMIAYHTESKSALAEQLRAIAKSKEVPEDVKDSMIRESSRLSSLAVAAGFFGLLTGASFIAAIYLRWFSGSSAPSLPEDAISSVMRMMPTGANFSSRATTTVDGKETSSRRSQGTAQIMTRSRSRSREREGSFDFDSAVSKRRAQ